MTSHPSTPTPASGLREALERLSDSFNGGWMKETRSETASAVEIIARTGLASLPAPEEKPEPDVVADDLVERLLHVASPAAEAYGDGDRIDRMVWLCDEAAAALQAERRKREEAEASGWEAAIVAVECLACQWGSDARTREQDDAITEAGQQIVAALVEDGPTEWLGGRLKSSDHAVIAEANSATLSIKLAAAEATIASLTATNAELRADLERAAEQLYEEGAPHFMADDARAVLDRARARSKTEAR